LSAAGAAVPGAVTARCEARQRLEERRRVGRAKPGVGAGHRREVVLEGHGGRRLVGARARPPCAPAGQHADPTGRCRIHGTREHDAWLTRLRGPSHGWISPCPTPAPPGTSTKRWWGGHLSPWRWTG